ncbi:unnamed protein product [Acanthoscelides obtectus]|uniref:Nucleolar protein 16 n=1 Tax=Acanthoscelides obtectus TaxID=200917 RepID=A0A9P0PP94_ACAOB|nr:unnamed protein product [Acanthoscelides obtectus]CAK1629630.1 Nucleolar protein 16 [Acanthoscelides obtectus]
MTKLRKQRRRKVFRHAVNRKRLRNKIFGVGSIKCKEIKEAWDNKRSVETNMKDMGLSCDPNKTIQVPKTLKASLMSNQNEWKEEEIPQPESSRSKSRVAQMLEEDAKAPRVRKIRLPNSQIEWLSYLILKYGNDYKAMAKDSKNYYQETWKQIRQKVRRFRSIPEQYYMFLRKNDIDISRDTLNSEKELSDDEL